MMDNLDDSSKKAQKDIFYKQQQQRLQHITLNKDLKADDLIKNILEKVDTDAKITKFYNAQNRNTYNYTSTASYSLPMPPCFHANVDIPNIYPKIWNLVKADNSLEFCDRDKLYQVLLLSQLASNVLAQLWSFVNRTLPGQLTKNELFVMLALVALIQSNSIDPQKELYSTTAIPIPFFTSLSEQEPFFKNGQTLSTAQNIVNITESSNSEKTLKNDKIDVLPIEEDFADFKCADLNIPVQDNTSLFNDTTSVDSNQIDTINLTPNKQSKDDDILSISNICDNLQDCSLFADKPKKDNSTTDIFMPICSPQECEPSEDDKYSSLRKLSINCLDGDEFGDFYSHSTENKCDKSINQVTNSLLENIPKESHKVISTKRKFLNACKQVMQKTFNILIVNHGEESVLEALSSKDGTNFAHGKYSFNILQINFILLLFKIYTKYF